MFCPSDQRCTRPADADDGNMVGAAQDLANWVGGSRRWIPTRLATAIANYCEGRSAGPG